MISLLITRAIRTDGHPYETGNQTMYVIELTYQKPLADIEAHLEAHRHFLDVHYEKGIFLASGPKNPRDGGVILASSSVNRQALEEILTKDPFRQHDLALYRITEFSPVKCLPVLKDVL